METVPMTLGEIHALIRRVLIAHGCDSANAEAVADTMTAAERDGAASHGLFRLPGHVRLLEAGSVNGRAEPSASRPAPGIVRVDGDRGFAPRAQAAGLPLLIEAAREQGIAALAIVRCLHFAALWPEVTALAEAGLVGIAVTSSPPYVAAAGGQRPVFGTNPMAFAWPRPGGAPMVWDQASAAMARGEIQLHLRDGHPLPPGAGIDADGNPSTDPAAVLAGAQLPFGGYKGSAIALMVDLLAGPLLDEVTSLEAGQSATGGGPQQGGELILALDPRRFGGGEGGLARAERLFAELTREQGVRLPGDRRLANRTRIAAQGVAVPTALFAEVSALAGD